jgi:hypothetical protein
VQLLENILHEVWGENIMGMKRPIVSKWKPTNVQQVAKEERKASNDQRIEHGNH